MKIMPLKLFPFLLFSDFHIWPKCSQNCLVLTSGELTGVHGCPSIVRSGFLGRCGSTGDFSPSVRVYEHLICSENGNFFTHWGYTAV